MRGKLRKGIVRYVLLLIVIIGVLGINLKLAINKPLKIDSVEIIDIKEGETFYGVLDMLTEEGKVRSKLLIKMYAKMSGLNLEVVPGKYILHRDMSIKEIAESFNTGSEYDLVKFTIPEGFTVDDIATKLEIENICDRDDFINSVKNYKLPTYVKDDPQKKYNLEGYLYPDTYKVELDTDPNYIIEIMLKRFKEVWDEVAKESGVIIKDDDIEKYVNIASMIEKESKTDEEKAIISSVIYNRLQIGMPLQIDATVIYAHGYHIDPVLYSHLEIDSLYNTYYHDELPVGPIANAGKPSLRAALKPDKTEYLFYLLETEDTHYFTDNYEDFEKRKIELGY